MTNRKILVFLHDNSVALQMSTYLDKERQKTGTFRLFIFLEKKNANKNLIKDIKFIFKNHHIRIFLISVKKLKVFTIRNIMNWPFIYKSNNKNYKFINYYLKRNSIDISKFDEALYTNEILSKYILYNFYNKKIFFFHGIGDYKIFIKQNYLKNFKNSLFYKLNRIFNHIILPRSDDNFACIYSSKIEFTNLNLNNIKLDLNIYKKKFKDFLNFKNKNINFSPKVNFTLLLLKFPRYKINKLTTEKSKFIESYLNYLFNHIKNFFCRNKKLENKLIAIKTKGNISSSELKIIKRISNKFFKKYNVKIYLNNKDHFINAEFLGINKYCKLIISNFSTTDFIIKSIYANKIILSYNALVYKFEKKYENINNKLFNPKFLDISKVVKKFNRFYLSLK